MPFAHIGFDVRPAKWGEVVAFYSKALAPLGYVEVMRIELGIMLGVKGAYELWIGKKEDAYERLNIHLALTAEGLCLSILLSAVVLWFAVSCLSSFLNWLFSAPLSKFLVSCSCRVSRRPLCYGLRIHLLGYV